MKVKIFDSIPNSGIASPVLKNNKFEYLDIKKGRYIHNDCSHPLRIKNNLLYSRVYGLEYKNHKIYWFNIFGNIDTNHGYHIGLNWWQNQRFLFLQNSHWFQKEENIRYIINIIFLVFGLIIAMK